MSAPSEQTGLIDAPMVCVAVLPDTWIAEHIDLAASPNSSNRASGERDDFTPAACEAPTMAGDVGLCREIDLNSSVPSVHTWEYQAIGIAECGGIILRVITVLIALFWATGLAAQNAAQSLEQLDQQIAALVSEAALPGASIAVVEDGEVVLVKGYGLANIETGANVSPATLFKGGSVSKNITSLLAVKLANDGVIDLNARLSDILPDATPRNPWSEQHPIRLIHLLEHTAGIEGSSYNEYASTAREYSPTEYARVMAPKLRVRWEPGFFFSYSNPGHTLLAAALEKQTGKDFDTLVREVIFEPLGMGSASFSRFSINDENLSRSYGPGGTGEQPHWDMTIRPSGGVIATPSDLAQLVKLYLARGRSGDNVFLPPELFNRIEVSQTSAAARSGLGPGTYGSGNFGFLDADHLFQGHWGATEGFRTHLGYSVPADGGYVVMTNANEGTSGAIRVAIAQYLTRDLPNADTYTAPGESRLAADAPGGWYLPFTNDMALRSWIMNLVGSTYITKNGDGSLSLSGLLPINPARTASLSGGDTFREGDTPVPTIAFVTDASSNIVLVDGEAKRSASWFQTVLPFGLLVGAILIGAMLAIYGIIAGILRLFRKPSEMKDSWLRLGLVLSGTSLSLLFAIFVFRGLLGDWRAVMDMGSISLTSLCLLALSLLGPAMLILALLRSRKLSNEGRVFKGFAVLCFVSLSAGWMILGANGWIPFVSFTH